MFKHILLPTDGSELSLRAVDTGLALAARLGASVHAFHVVMPFPATVYVAEVVLADEDIYARESVARSARYLAEVEARARAAGVACQSSCVTDHRPYTAILEAAVSGHCDLIVMASHGWRGPERRLRASETHPGRLNGAGPGLVCH